MIDFVLQVMFLAKLRNDILLAFIFSCRLEIYISNFFPGRNITDRGLFFSSSLNLPGFLHFSNFYARPIIGYRTCVGIRFTCTDYANSCYVFHCRLSASGGSRLFSQVVLVLYFLLVMYLYSLILLVMCLCLFHVIWINYHVYFSIIFMLIIN
jgi:hypothetical protein